MDRSKKTSFLWLLCLMIACLIILFFSNSDIKHIGPPNYIIILLLFAISAFCEYIDSSLGMGYGTTLTPLLLTLGAVRIDIVPAILFAELLSGFFAGIRHHQEGNVNLISDKKIRTAFLYLAIPSVLGVIIATLLGSYFLGIAQQYANLYIGLMIITIGLYITYNFYFRKGKQTSFSKLKLMTLGTVAAFNKGVSGGGYGPLLTGGQITAGISDKQAIVVTSLCEGFTCLVGLLTYFALGGSLNYFYVIPLCLGSVLSVIPAAKTIKILPENTLRKGIGWATLLLGCLTLWKFLIK